ncbi:MAG: hypothetical protein Q7U39_01350 [Nitrospira sp.]|nr:hypothetical protein [Nitrospira sp.]
MRDRDVRQTNESSSGPSGPERQDSSDSGQPYLYRHAGITERGGHIPFWLILVVVGLLLWSIYYAIEYWSPG